MSFRSYNHKTYIVTCSKTGILNHNEKDEELQDDDMIATYPDRIDIPFVKYFDDKIMIYLILMKN